MEHVATRIVQCVVHSWDANVISCLLDAAEVVVAAAGAGDIRRGYSAAIAGANWIKTIRRNHLPVNGIFVYGSRTMVDWPEKSPCSAMVGTLGMPAAGCSPANLHS